MDCKNDELCSHSHPRSVDVHKRGECARKRARRRQENNTHHLVQTVTTVQPCIHCWCECDLLQADVAAEGDGTITCQALSVDAAVPERG
jgi:hypothetical protein